jgi:hypothetical protein
LLTSFPLLVSCRPSLNNSFNFCLDLSFLLRPSLVREVRVGQTKWDPSKVQRPLTIQSYSGYWRKK